MLSPDKYSNISVYFIQIQFKLYGEVKNNINELVTDLIANEVNNLR